MAWREAAPGNSQINKTSGGGAMPLCGIALPRPKRPVESATVLFSFCLRLFVQVSNVSVVLE